MNNLNLQDQIEALLFTFGMLSREELSRKLATPLANIEEAVTKLFESKKSGAISLIDDGRMLELRSSPDASQLIENSRRDEYAQGIGKAGLEALAAILYRGPLTRSEIDFIRGVNSTQTLRTLAMRGLVRRIPNPNDERSFLYEPSTETLAHLGVSHISDLPEFDSVREKLQSLENEYRSKERSEESAGNQQQE